VTAGGLTDPQADALAARLAEATRSRRPIPPISSDWPALTAADAYRIQERIVGARLRDGDRIVGWKLGLTSGAMQQQLGVDQPDYGPMLGSWTLDPGAEISLGELIQPRVEAEIAVILSRPLRGPGVTRSVVETSITGLAAAIEVIDSRIEGWRIGLVDTIADLASTARVLVSRRVVPAVDFEARLVGCVLERDGSVVATGAGAAALGDPLDAVAWAANTLGALGVTLEPGRPVMTGALHASVPVTGPGTFEARFDRLGSLSVSFVP
jgi:2-keto-4-pentenoate hydratase